jgi:oligoendopeptidase F
MAKRNFVPDDLNPDDEKAVSKLYRALLQREIPVNMDKLRQWIMDWSEVESVLGEESSRRYVAMTCDTRDEQAAKAYAGFI